MWTNSKTSCFSVFQMNQPWDSPQVGSEMPYDCRATVRLMWSERELACLGFECRRCQWGLAPAEGHQLQSHLLRSLHFCFQPQLVLLASAGDHLPLCLTLLFKESVYLSFSQSTPVWCLALSRFGKATNPAHLCSSTNICLTISNLPKVWSGCFYISHRQ